MDPALEQLLEATPPGEEVELVLRLHSESRTPPGVRIVARFGKVVTCRVASERVRETWGHESVASVKAPRLLAWDPPIEPQEIEPEALSEGAVTQKAEREVTGKGVILAALDWGMDFAHPHFLDSEGSTRLLALWDQGGEAKGAPDSRYGYGVVHSREDINRALREQAPYQSLHYHPAKSDPRGKGAHGTHVLDIAAGLGILPGSTRGVAPEADLIFVQLATKSTSGLADLGDSVRVLEALDFVARTAGDRPWVCNMSLGRMGGAHDGLSLVEQGMDALLEAAPGRAICQSAGNYYSTRTHAEGIARPGREEILGWIVDPADRTPNELEVWYSGRDRLKIRLTAPEASESLTLELGKHAPITVDDREVGHIYHRSFDPNNSDHHVDVFLYPEAPPGRWELALIPDEILDGRYSAWIERDPGRPSSQSRFEASQAAMHSTTGTICNGFRPIVVGAYDAHSSERELGSFSSAGPTREGRIKPDLVAPGVRVLAAKSTAKGARPGSGLLVRQSGTSMATPHVTGTVALMFEAAKRPLRISETRALLLGSCAPGEGYDSFRVGSGFLDVDGAVAAAARGTLDFTTSVEKVSAREALPEETPAESAVPVVHQEIGLLEGTYGSSTLYRGSAAAPADAGGHKPAELVMETSNGAVGEAGRGAFRPSEADFATSIDEPPSASEADSFAKSIPQEGPAELEEDLEFQQGTPEFDDESDLLEAIEEWIESDAEGQSVIAAKLAELGRAPDTVSLHSSGELVAHPASLFSFATQRHHVRELARRFSQSWELIAGPGEELPDALEAGDLLLRRPLGEGSWTHEAILATGEILSASDLFDEGLEPEALAEGYFAQVLEVYPRKRLRRHRFARRLGGPYGRLGNDQVILRLRRFRPHRTSGAAPAILLPDSDEADDLGIAEVTHPVGTDIVGNPGKTDPTDSRCVFVDVPIFVNEIRGGAYNPGKKDKADDLRQLAKFLGRLPGGNLAELHVGTSVLERVFRVSGASYQIPLRARVMHPATSAGGSDFPKKGKFPVVVIVHGNAEHYNFGPFPGPNWVATGTSTPPATPGGTPTPHFVASSLVAEFDSHTGFDYLQEELAENGIVSISVSTNPAHPFENLIETRARLAVAALDFLHAKSNEKGSRYRNKLNFKKVGLIGHSRGGDAVVRAFHFILNNRAGRYTVRAVTSLSPTDFTGTTSNPLTLGKKNKVFYQMVYGSHDGDVAPPTGFTGTAFRHYDRAGCPRSMVFIHKANHNRFNNAWPTSDPAPHPSFIGGVLTSADHKTLAKEYIGELHRMMLTGDKSLKDRFDGTSAPSVATDIAIQWRFGKRTRLIDNFGGSDPGKNSLLGAITTPAGLTSEAQIASSSTNIPHQDKVLKISVVSGGGGTYRSAIPRSREDFTKFDLLTFRMTRLFDITALPTEPFPEFKVRLVDVKGNSVERDQAVVFADTPLGPTKPIEHKIRRGGDINVTKIHMETLQLRLAPLKSASPFKLNDVAAVEFVFAPPPPDTIFIDTISLIKK